MFVSCGTLAPVTLKRSAATVDVTARGCDLSVPYTGTLTPHKRALFTSTLRQRMITMRYGTRLKGLTVSTDDQVLTVTAVASNFAIRQWLDSGDFIAAVDAAVRHARA